MRYIPLEDFKPDQDWLNKANALLDQLKAAPDTKERNRLIDNNNDVWGELKDALLVLSHQKCWFSEAKDCFNHWDVEHYRPKKSAKDVDGTKYDGYWWLSFDWQNFRICGNVGNRKKGTFFPLRDGCPHVTDPIADLRYEEPVLLDPADKDDPNLLSFNMEGRAIPAPHVQDKWEQLRVTYSVERFLLDFPTLMDKRKVVWNDCWKRIQTYRTELERYQRDKNLIAKDGFKKSAQNIREMLVADKEFSSVARACVLGSGDERVIRILQTI